MDTLAQIYARHSGGKKFNDRGSVHSYIQVYEEIFKPYRETAKRVLEIGLFDGHGMRMISEYFLNAIVSGIDISDQPHGGLADLRPMISEKKFDIEIMNACEPGDVGLFIWNRMPDPNNTPVFDVVIDDASHEIGAQMKIYENFWPHVAPGGLYVIEDVQDLQTDRSKFEDLGFEIIDRRKIKNRYDDVLAIKRKI